MTSGSKGHFVPVPSISLLLKSTLLFKLKFINHKKLIFKIKSLLCIKRAAIYANICSYLQKKYALQNMRVYAFMRYMRDQN